MLRRLPLYFAFSVVALVAACTPTESTDTAPSGCAPGTSCNACHNCYELCVCVTGDLAGCPVACETGQVGGAGGTGGGYPVGGSGGGGGTTPAGGLATALAITEIALFQGVKVPLMQNGSEPPKKAPIVADRDGMIRVYVTPDPEYQPREIVARVELGGSAPGTFDVKAFIGEASTDADAASTLNVPIPGANIKPDTTYTVSLLEATSGSFPGMNGGAKWGAAALGAQSMNGVLEIVLVPVSINGIVPKTDEASIKAYRDRMMKLYPAPSVDIQIRQTAIYTGTVPTYSGSGWNSLLNWLMQLRSYDKTPARKYYYGVVAPKNSFKEFCPGGCVAGLSSQPDADMDPVYRVGSGVGFFPSGGTPSSADTMAHEVGHTAGLGHAPCVPPGSSIQGVDPAYPYAQGAIGSWGWDIITQNYLDPAKYKDMMGYCDPYVHVADWTFSKLFQRLSYTNATGDALPSSDPERAPGKFSTILVEADGSMTWGLPIETSWATMAEKKELNLLDATGKVVGKLTGFWYAHDHLGGGTLFVRSKNVLGQGSATKLALTGATLALPH